MTRHPKFTRWKRRHLWRNPKVAFYYWRARLRRSSPAWWVLENSRPAREWLWDWVWYPWLKRPYLWVVHPRRMLYWRRMRLTGEQIYELGNYQSIGPIRDEETP